jgi:hypothetical protein
VTYNHPCDTKKTTPYETLRVAYPTLEEIRPAELRNDTWSYVPKCDDSFRRRGRHEIESGREDNNI